VVYTAYAERGVVSTDTDGGSYEWYSVYNCTRYVLNLVSAMSCLCNLVHVYVCTHVYTHRAVRSEVLIFLVHVYTVPEYLHAV
jgi:hypothetical protein